MNGSDAIAAHYGEAGIGDRVLSALSEEGVDIDNLSWDQLATIDQFHTRGLPATREQAALADPRAGGIGARYRLRCWRAGALSRR